MKLLESLEPGDMVKVYEIDRLARSLMDLLSILDRIQKVGASFQSLTEPVDTSTSAGRMMTHMLGAFAEFERGIIRERSIAGQTAAMMRGIHCGRPRSISPGDEQEIVRLWKSNQYTMDSLAALFKRPPVEREAVDLSRSQARTFELAITCKVRGGPLAGRPSDRRERA